MDDYELLKDLNTEQKEAATFKDGHELVLAGAGTGKTKMLISHVAWLLNEGVKPWNILMLTFTNAAANEMKERLVKMVGPTGNDVTAQTFHSWCNVFLHINAEKIHMENFSVLDEDDASDAINVYRIEIMDRMKNEKIKDWREFPSVKDIRKIKSMSVYQMKDVSEVLNRNADFYDEILEVLNKYETSNIEKKRMDFDDLLLYTYDLLKTDDELRKQTDEHYRYVMCDEYQDTDMIQDAILKLITQDAGNLVVVGDDNQSIYKFRGAEVKNILGFSGRYSDTKEVTLYQNYRSNQEILDLANAIMEHAKEGIPKTLKGTHAEGELPKLVRMENERDEASYIVEAVEDRHIYDNVPYHEIAVLCRNSNLLKRVEPGFRRDGIETVVKGGTSFFSDPVIRDLLCFVRVSDDINDEIALTRLLTRFIYRVGAKTADKIVKDVQEHGLLWLSEGNHYGMTFWASDVTEFGKMLNYLCSLNFRDMLEKLISEGYYKNLWDRNDAARERDGKRVDIHDTEHMTREEHLKESEILLSMAEGYRSARSFINDVVLENKSSENNDGDKVVLSTIHSAKGLEFDTVILIGARKDMLPKENESEEDQNEDLRCLYVAVTRAKNRLIITCPKWQNISGKGYGSQETPVRLSPFLDYPDVLNCMQIETVI